MSDEQLSHEDPDDGDDDDAHCPAELLELFEVLEWEKATKDRIR
jgi:hypothetical protein